MESPPPMRSPAESAASIRPVNRMVVSNPIYFSLIAASVGFWIGFIFFRIFGPKFLPQSVAASVASFFVIYASLLFWEPGIAIYGGGSMCGGAIVFYLLGWKRSLSLVVVGLAMALGDQFLLRSN